jgi:hypothetical protein
MEPTPPIIRQTAEPGSRGSYVVLWLALGFFALIGLGAYGISSFLRLSRDTAVLRDCLLEAVPSPVEKKIAVSVGPITTGFVRLGSRFFNVPPEPRAALNAFRSGEVGIYRLETPPTASERATIISKADKSMGRCGWTRVVGVAQKEGLVAVYAPAKGMSMSRMKCCVMVLNDCDVVLVSARANLNPLVALAKGQFDIRQQFEQFAAAGIR